MLCVCFSLIRERWWLSSRIGVSVGRRGEIRKPMVEQQSSRIDPCQSILVVPSIILDHNNLTSRIGLAHQPPTTPISTIIRLLYILKFANRYHCHQRFTLLWLPCVEGFTKLLEALHVSSQVAKPGLAFRT
ncbi:hypothetical protein VC83_00610 [Pseudogymnoascus destructans]|uniref:Uncharacterized protein n=1 Tax=Pseudogymnoascus destructans TaxID=655981 RepID=A0A177ALS6_9PEZI|nr:uncharacterized protein VC83_00610 [Pseudogymnoascus destructans]OAF62988.1 hypothetical protein VC83_00610 [Pseudogymnoascus destructans]